MPTEQHYDNQKLAYWQGRADLQEVCARAGVSIPQTLEELDNVLLLMRKEQDVRYEQQRQAAHDEFSLCSHLPAASDKTLKIVVDAVPDGQQNAFALSLHIGRTQVGFVLGCQTANAAFGTLKLGDEVNLVLVRGTAKTRAFHLAGENERCVASASEETRSIQALPHPERGTYLPRKELP